MEHLRWIKDEAVRNTIDVFQSEMESVIWGLLDQDPHKAVAQLEAARDDSLKRVKDLNFDFIPIEQETELLTRVLGLIEHSFTRMLRIAKAVRDDDGPGAEP